MANDASKPGRTPAKSSRKATAGSTAGKAKAASRSAAAKTTKPASAAKPRSTRTTAKATDKAAPQDPVQAQRASISPAGASATAGGSRPPRTTAGPRSEGPASAVSASPLGTPHPAPARSGAGSAMDAPVRGPAQNMPGASSAAATAPAKLAVVSSPGPAMGAAEMKRPELIDKVVERSGIKKREAKPVIDALLAVLGETLEAGRDLNIKPLGKLKPVREKKLPNGVNITARLRRVNIAAPPAKQGLAKRAKDS